MKWRRDRVEGGCSAWAAKDLRGEQRLVLASVQGEFRLRTAWGCCPHLKPERGPLVLSSQHSTRDSPPAWGCGRQVGVAGRAWSGWAGLGRPVGRGCVGVVWLGGAVGKQMGVIGLGVAAEGRVGVAA